MSEEVVTPQPEADPEPEGVIEVSVADQKQRVVPVTVIAAERQRVRAAEREKVTKEYEPLKAKAALADQLQQDVQALQPHIDYLKAHPELLQREQPPELQAVSDEDAERYARDYELYSASGLDLGKAKRIIARQRDEVKRVAAEAAQAAVRPVAESNAIQQSKQNFLWAASQRSADGRPLVDPTVLMEEWKQIPAELAAQPQVAELLLEKAIGRQLRSGKQPPAAPDRDPLFSEPSGGRAQGYQISELERKVSRNAGISEADWSKAATTYKPDQINVLGD